MEYNMLNFLSILQQLQPRGALPGHDPRQALAAQHPLEVPLAPPASWSCSSFARLLRNQRFWQGVPAHARPLRTRGHVFGDGPHSLLRLREDDVPEEGRGEGLLRRTAVRDAAARRAPSRQVGWGGGRGFWMVPAGGRLGAVTGRHRGFGRRCCWLWPR